MTVFIKHKLNDVASISDTNGDLKLNQSNVYSLFVSCTCDIGLLAIDFTPTCFLASFKIKVQQLETGKDRVKSEICLSDSESDSTFSINFCNTSFACESIN